MEGVIEVKYWKPSKPPEKCKNGEKMAGSTHVLADKLPKTPFFAHKYLTRYTHEMFFEEYTNFEAHYLSRCRDIPLQSFGSHLRPQLHGLGLMIFSSLEIFLVCRPPLLQSKVHPTIPPALCIPPTILGWDGTRADSNLTPLPPSQHPPIMGKMVAQWQRT